MFSRLAIFSCLAGVLLAQTPARASDSASANSWLARTWQTEDGLPDNSVSGLLQSDDGFLWVATLGGLMRFDGNKFDEFSLLHIPGVANRVVRNVYMDSRGRMWLAMDRGSVLCVGRDDAHVFSDADGLENVRINCITEDVAGNTWLAQNNAFYRITGTNVTRFGVEQGVPTGGHPWLAADARGQLWFARGSQVGVFRDGGWHTLLHTSQTPVRVCAARDGAMWICAGDTVLKFSENAQPEERAYLPEKSIVTMMYEDREGVLWIGTTAGGLFELNGGNLERVETSHDEISCAFEDREGNFWIGTAGGGLNLLRPRAVNLIDTKSGLPSASIKSVCLDSNGWFWCAMNDGTLVRGRGTQWDALGDADDWPGATANCVAAARDGGIWIGTRDQGVLHLRDGKFEQWGRDRLGAVFIHALLVADNGDVWIATHTPDRLVRLRGKEFHQFDPPGDVRVIRALAARDGIVWAGTSGGQLLRCDGTNLVLESAVVESRPMSVRTLHVTPDGSLWIGYAGWGVGRLWNGHYARVTMADGLHDNYISQIQSDDAGGLWFTSNHGLFQVRLEEICAVTAGKSPHFRSIVYDRNEGVSTLQAVFDDSPNTVRSPDGQLWFATRNGLVQVLPNRIRDNTNPPPVVVERVAVDDATIALWDSQSRMRSGADTNAIDLRTAQALLQLPPGHRKIEFEFAALSLTSPENVNFRYRLKNYDAEWNDPGAQRVAKYPQLPPGRYEFQVDACNNAGVWNDAGVRLGLEVTPFFWQQWWFRVVAVLGFTGCIIGTVRYFSFRRLRRELEQLERQAELQRERSRIARDMHDEVGSKLSRLSFLSEIAGQQPGLPASARGDVAEISETARDTIRSFEEIVWAVNPKNDSLAQLMNYLCRFAEEFFDGSATQCVFDMPDTIPAVELPTGARHHIFLAAKEALNNVFKHAQAARVCIRLQVMGDGFEIVIEDNGRGFGGEARQRAGAGTGNGLENMRERLRQAGGEFEMHSVTGGGTRVILKIRQPQKTPG